MPTVGRSGVARRGRGAEIRSSPPTSMPKEEQENGTPSTPSTEEKTADETLLEEKPAVMDLVVKGEDPAEDPESVKLDDSQFNKLETLLSQTQLYSEFLLEKMHNMAFVKAETTHVVETHEEEQESKRGVKRKVSVTTSRVTTRVKQATHSVSPDVEEKHVKELEALAAEKERIGKEQKEIIPLLSGGTLKSYQLKGVKWLISLWQNGLNGILADQMGLGKTIQAIGLLAHLKGKDMHGPFLVVAPLSTLSNWVFEIKKWAPTMKVILYHGTKDERAEMRRIMPAAISPDFPVVVTSYEVAINDRRFLCRRKWKYLVVDEGHRLKNFDCKLIRELKMIPTENTLLLTGTPLQNNLSELWSLLNFILPDTFTSLRQFESWFDLSGKQSHGLNKEEIDEQRRLEVVKKLHKILRPFLLRRIKEEVEKNMPLKKEIIFYAPMTKEQLKFQNLLISNTLSEHFEAKNKGAGFRSRLNNVVMQLRKNANHPDLLISHFEESMNYPPVEDLLAQCGKLKLLERLLMHLKQRGHKVLIFSQMTRMLDILEHYLSESGMDPDPCRIDGQVKLADRQRQIQEFNSDRHERFIFLLSTRAGGLGINLTAADTVIIYDSDWNPHMDLQAMDRCHRIGQEKPVHVYRLLTAQSIECKMMKVANRKMQLEHVVIEKGQFKQEQYAPKTQLEEYDLLALLRQGRDTEEEYIQSSEISDASLLRALDRTELFAGMYAHAPVNPGLAFPPKGPGWEVVTKGDCSSNILSAIDPFRKQERVE